MLTLLLLKAFYITFSSLEWSHFYIILKVQLKYVCVYVCVILHLHVICHLFLFIRTTFEWVDEVGNRPRRRINLETKLMNNYMH